MCKWWKSNLDYLIFSVRNGIWKIGVSDLHSYEEYDLVVIRFCPGCGHILDQKGCTNISLNADKEAQIYSDIAMKGE